GERGPALADAHESALRTHRGAIAAIAAHRAGGQRVARRPGGGGERAARVRRRPLAALRQERLQEITATGFGGAAQIPIRLRPNTPDSADRAGRELRASASRANRAAAIANSTFRRRRSAASTLLPPGSRR